MWCFWTRRAWPDFGLSMETQLGLSCFLVPVVVSFLLWGGEGVERKTKRRTTVLEGSPKKHMHTHTHPQPHNQGRTATSCQWLEYRLEGPVGHV